MPITTGVVTVAFSMLLTTHSEERLDDHFWRYVTIYSGRCWQWQSGQDGKGYPILGIGSRKDGTRRTARVHRLAYEAFVGSIPPELELDHLCRNRSCVNPWHLEAVTHQENVRRGAMFKTHCVNGHPYDGANISISSKGRRYCRTCTNERARESYAARIDFGRARNRESYHRNKGIKPPATPGIKGWQARQLNKTHCPQGHPYDAGNTAIRRRKDNWASRYCRACQRERALKRYHASKTKP